MDDTTVTGASVHPGRECGSHGAAVLLPAPAVPPGCPQRHERYGRGHGHRAAVRGPDAAEPSVADNNTRQRIRPITTEGKSRFDAGWSTLSLRRVTLAYVAAGVAFAAVFAGAWSAQAGDGFLPIRFLVLTVNFSWPVVLALSQLAALGRRDRLRFVGLYLVVFVVATAPRHVGRPRSGPAQPDRAMADLE